MNTQNVKLLEIVAMKPTHVLVKLESSDQAVKMSKSFFQKCIRSGNYEVVNQQALPSII